MDSESDTIAAISTAPGEAGIAIVRVSGSHSLAIADAVFSCAAPQPSRRADRTFVYGKVRGEGATDADEAILLIYRSPRSYTREDVIELQSHGGKAGAERVLRAVLDAGARPAQPGEFTRRAFLNGRIDLLQAEAVLDLIRAKSDRAAAAAVEQLEGSLTSSFTSIYDALLTCAADLEAILDFEEGELPEETFGQICDRLKSAAQQMQMLLATWEEGHVLREGALVVIAGSPNVGKSTLLNTLLGRDRAIVADTPGTTRDTIEEQLILSGVPLRLVDTAGLRLAQCHIEREGVQRARASADQADLVLHVVDASRPLLPEESSALLALEPARMLLVLNKADLGSRVNEADFPHLTAVSCSLLTGEGFKKLKAVLSKAIVGHLAATPHAAISTRHRQLIQRALNELNGAIDIMDSGRDDLIVPAAASVRCSLEILGTATGRVYTDELLDSIFSRFCIGK